jgi:hypothetical protein
MLVTGLLIGEWCEHRCNLRIVQRILLLISIMILVSCGSCVSWRQKIPPGDIIFQSNMRQPYELNIINSDGSGQQTLKLPQNFIKPVWSIDGEYLIGLSNPRGQFTHEDIGYPSYWNVNTGKFYICDDNMPLFEVIQEFNISRDQFEVLLSVDKGIVSFDLNTCNQTKVVVDRSNLQGQYATRGISFFSKTQELVYGRSTVPYENRRFAIIKHGLITGEEDEIAEGINPIWSPDGTMIAYIGFDGLYIMEIESNSPRLLVKSSYFNPIINDFNFNTPQPRWSPDGKWLVYHQCGEDNCSYKSTTIYKIRVADSYNEEIFTGGIFPTWMP